MLLQTFFSAVSAVSVLLLIMLLGYFLGRLGWIGKSEKQFLGKYILNVAVPCLCLTGVLNNFKRDMMADLALFFVLSMSAIIILLLLAALLAHFLKLPRKQRGVFIAMSTFANTLFIGIPICTQLFGNESLPYVLVYYLSSSSLVQIVGVMLIEHAGKTDTNAPTPKNIKGVLKNLLSVFNKPPILGMVCALILLFLNLRPPEFIMSFAGYISNTVSALALIYCGYIFYEIGILNLRFSKSIIIMIIFRLVLSPAICLIFYSFAHIDSFAGSVMLIESALPIITSIMVMSGLYGADEQFAASGTCLSILCGFVTIPIWRVLVAVIW